MAAQPSTHSRDQRPPTLNVLAISGSLAPRSSNSALVRLAAAQEHAGIQVHVYEHLADLPHFNPDLDREPPPQTVAVLRGVARDAHALLIASPEYAHEMPGSLKNALDW